MGGVAEERRKGKRRLIININKYIYTHIQISETLVLGRNTKKIA